jgi:hypothetical protein
MNDLSISSLINKSCSKYFANDTTNFSTVLMNTQVVDSSKSLSVIKIQQNISNLNEDCISSFIELESINETQGSMNESNINNSNMVQQNGENLNILHELNSISYLDSSFKQNCSFFSTGYDNSTPQLLNGHYQENLFDKFDTADLNQIEIEFSSNLNHQMSRFSHSSCCLLDLPPKSDSYL